AGMPGLRARRKTSGLAYGAASYRQRRSLEGFADGARSARQPLEHVVEHRRSRIALGPGDDEVLPAEHLRPEIEGDVLHLPLRPVPAERLQLPRVHRGAVDAHPETLVRNASRLERLRRIGRFEPALAILNGEAVHRALRDRAVKQTPKAGTAVRAESMERLR